MRMQNQTEGEYLYLRSFLDWFLQSHESQHFLTVIESKLAFLFGPSNHSCSQTRNVGDDRLLPGAQTHDDGIHAECIVFCDGSQY